MLPHFFKNVYMDSTIFGFFILAIYWPILYDFAFTVHPDKFNLINKLIILINSIKFS